VHFEQQVVFVPPSSNLMGSGLLLLGLASRDGRPARPMHCRMACSLSSSGHDVSRWSPTSSAARTIRRIVFRSKPVDRAMARIFSPANHRADHRDRYP